MVGEGGSEGDTATHNHRGLIFGQYYPIRYLLSTQLPDLKILDFFRTNWHKLA